MVKLWSSTWSRVLVAATLALSSCRDEPAPGDPNAPMFDEVAAWVWDNGYSDGDWEPDWDDAPFYGPALYGAWSADEDDPTLRQRADEAVAHNLALAEAGLADPLGAFVDDASAILYGTLGVIDFMAATGDRGALETVDEVLATASDMLTLMGGYVSGFENYATDTYGPTSITAIFALLFLQHAALLDTDRAEDYTARAQEVIGAVDERVWNGSYYLFAPDRPEELFLYPNVAMMIANTRLYELTGEERYLTRAEEVYQAIQALKYDFRPGYHSPYSQVTMGAQTDDYTTLSATNYAMLAMALLAEDTGQEVYRTEIDTLLGFIRDYLWVPGDGRVYHHWMDGRLAVPEDPEYYCIGCNLQLLYIIRWVRTHLE